MKLAVIVRQSDRMARPDQLPELIQAFIEWRQRYAGQIEHFHMFVGGEGGIGLVNPADEETAHMMLFEAAHGPFRFAEMEIKPVVDGDWALQFSQKAIAAAKD